MKKAALGQTAPDGYFQSEDLRMHAKDKYKLSFLKNNLWVTVGSFLVYAKGVILLPILIKTIGVTSYGGYSLLLTLVTFLYGISSFGVGFRFRRFFPSLTELHAKRESFYFQFFCQLFSVVLFCLLLGLAHDTLNNHLFKHNIGYSGLLLSLLLLLTFTWSQFMDFFRYSSNMKTFSISNTLVPYIHIGLIVLVIHVFRYPKINDLLLTNIIALAAVSVFLLRKILRQIGFSVPRLDAYKIVGDMKLGFPLVLSYVVDFTLMGSDKFIIALFMTTREVGYYAPAYLLGSFVLMFSRISGVVLTPMLSELTDKGALADSKTLIDKSIKFYLMLALPYIAGAVVLSKPLLTILANREVADNAFLVAPIVAGGVLFYGLNVIFLEVLFVNIRTRAILKINLLTAIVNICLNVLLIYIFRSIVTAAITAFMTYLFSFLIINGITQRMYQLSYNYRMISKMCLAAALMGAILKCLFTLTHSTLSVLWIIPTGICFYLVMLYFLGVFNNKELYLLKMLLPRTG